MLKISERVAIPDTEIEWSAIRAGGPGGQHVNKVSSAVHLRFDVAASSLPDRYKQRLLSLSDRRLSKDGVLIIKAQRYRTQDDNLADALRRLGDLIRGVMVTQRRRVPTRPSRAAKKRRLDAKSKRGKLKSLRAKPQD